MPSPGSFSRRCVPKRWQLPPDRGCKDHETWDRRPHELRREALPEGARGCGGATGAPD
jgi:hypothetical protein